MLTLHRKHDIANRKRDEALHVEATEAGNKSQASVIEIRNLVSAEVSTIQTGIDKVVSKVTLSHDGLRTQLRNGYNDLHQQVVLTEKKNFRTLGNLSRDVRDNSLSIHRDRR